VDLLDEDRQSLDDIGDDASLRFLAGPYVPIELRQPKVDEVWGYLVRALCIPPTNSAGADVLAKLKFERHRMPTTET
jgi:hypothetical protein